MQIKNYFYVVFDLRILIIKCTFVRYMNSGLKKHIVKQLLKNITKWKKSDYLQPLQ